MFETEIGRLRALEGRREAVTADLEKRREETVRCEQEIADLKIQAILNPDISKELAARCRKLDAQRVAARDEADKLAQELNAITPAIQRLEYEAGVRRHEQLIEQQAQFRESYRDVARKLLEAANRLEALTTEAATLFEKAQREFPYEMQHMDAGGVVLRGAGLSQIWDRAWVNYGQGSRRDVVVEEIFKFDRGLVDSGDRVARAITHQENFRSQLSEQLEQERIARANPDAKKPATFHRTTPNERQSGRWADPNEIKAVWPPVTNRLEAAGIVARD